jgi:hypothetical protein
MPSWHGHRLFLYLFTEVGFVYIGYGALNCTTVFSTVELGYNVMKGTEYFVSL